MLNRLVRCCGILALPCAALHAAEASAETPALIMTISNYSVPGVPPLKGVAQDAASAREIARRLGGKEANITYLRDQQLDWKGMNAAFDRLQERIAPNDDVFIYYSCHSGRQLVKDPEERCAELLIAQEVYGILAPYM